MFRIVPPRTVQNIAIFASLLALAILAAAYFVATPHRDVTRIPATLRAVSLRLMESFGPVYSGEMVAKSAGLFSLQEIQVELHPGSPEVDPIELVVNGSATIGITGADKILLALQKELPIVAFAAASIESTVAFYALEQSRIRMPENFLGRRIGYQIGQDTAMIYEALMAKARISRNRLREISVLSDVSQLVKGEVDVWPGYITNTSYALDQKGIRYNVIRPSNYGVHALGAVYFTTEKIIRDDPEVIRRFLRAVIAGWELVYDDYARSIPLIASFDEKVLTPEFIKFALHQQRDYVRPPGTRFGEFDQSQWKTLQDMMLRQRLLLQSLDLSKGVTFEFLRDAYRKSGLYAK